MKRRSPGHGLVLEWLVALMLGAAVLAVHDVGYILGHPFWLDESWVADSVRARIGLIPWLTSSTPLGFTFIIRLVPGSGAQRFRLVPLAFAGLAVLAGYFFGRELRLSRYLTGILTGAAVLLSPAMLVRNDLKQYTAEACAAVFVWFLVARLENQWTRPRLAALATFAALSLLLADTTIFVGVAAIVGLAVECLIKGQWRRLLELAAVAAGMLAVSGVIYEVVLKRNVIPSLTAYWQANYIPRNRGLHGEYEFARRLTLGLWPYMGLRSHRLDVLFLIAGVVVLAGLRRYALALMFPLTILLVLVASAARKYPYGDLRTSTFWLVLTPVVGAVPVAFVASRLSTFHRALPLVAVVLAIGAWLPSVHPYLRSHTFPGENVRSQVVYLNSHMVPGDLIIVDSSANDGFAYYEQRWRPTFVHDPSLANGFRAIYPHVPSILTMVGRQPSDVLSALVQASAFERREGAAATGRVWIIRSHLLTAEAMAWNSDLSGKSVDTIEVGSEPLLLYRMNPAPPS